VHDFFDVAIFAAHQENEEFEIINFVDLLMAIMVSKLEYVEVSSTLTGKWTVSFNSP